MAVRRKTLEVMGLLYSAAKHTSPHPSAAPSAAGVGHGGPGSALPIPSQSEERSLNPTTGVNHRGPEWIGQRVSFQRNPSLPGGGVFLAEGEVRKKLLADGRGPNVGPLGAEEMHAQSGSNAQGTGRTPRMGDRPGSGDFEPFNVNPHIHVRSSFRRHGDTTTATDSSITLFWPSTGHRHAQHGRRAG